MYKNENVVISTKEKVAFGFGDFASNLSWQTTMLFLAFYFTDIYGISAAAVGTIFLVSRFFDAFTDPIIGYLADKTKTRWGRYRPYILFMAVPFGILSYIPYSAPEFANEYKETFALISYLLLVLGFTMINIPYSSLGNVITRNNESRISMQSYRFAMTAAAGLIVSIGVSPLAELIGGMDKVAGYRGAMIVMGGIAAIFFLLCFLGVRERINIDSHIKLNFRSAFRSIFRNKALLLLTLTMLLSNMMGAVKFGGTLYFVKYLLNAENMSAVYLGAMMFGGVCGGLFAQKASHYFNKLHLYAFSTLMQAVACVSIFVVNSQLFIFSQFAFGFFFWLMLIPQFSLISDYVDDYAEKENVRYDGFAIASCIFVMKTGGALGGAIMGWILGIAGYTGTAENSQSALNAIQYLYGLYPTVLLCLLTLVILFLLPKPMILNK
ncbi:MFS transporter [Gallibacterium trehalosifermentans]|uniref:MFS transporter n=1 Tax=Gallibacterium trehalosifermentans TaxID=516935 RepID=A0ABV6H2B2_9PAST